MEKLSMFVTSTRSSPSELVVSSHDVTIAGVAGLLDLNKQATPTSTSPVATDT
jgi:hypothetical protein